MYTIYVKFQCFDGKREAFIEAVKNEGILSAIREENGCLGYDYYLSDTDKNEILLIEGWETREHQQIHLTQPHMARLREIKEDHIHTTVLGEFTLND